MQQIARTFNMPRSQSLQSFRSRKAHSDEERIRLFKQINKAGGAQGAREEVEVLMGSYKHLVRKIALKHENRGLFWADLLQEGEVGLWIAIDKYAREAKYGVEFSIYAKKYIRDAIVEAIIRAAREKRKVKRAVQLDNPFYGSSRSMYERIPNPISPNPEEILTGLEALSQHYDKLSDTERRALKRDIELASDAPSKKELFAKYAEWAVALSPSEETAFLLLYVQGVSPEEAGKIMGIQPRDINERGRRALRKLNEMSEYPGSQYPWRDDPKAFELILGNLSETERELYNITFKRGKWVSNRKAAELLRGKLKIKISPRAAANLRQQLRLKLQKLHNAAQNGEKIKKPERKHVLCANIREAIESALEKDLGRPLQRKDIFSRVNGKGVTEKTFSRWSKADPEIAALVEKALQRNLRDRIISAIEGTQAGQIVSLGKIASLVGVGRKTLSKKIKERPDLQKILQGSPYIRQ